MIIAKIAFSLVFAGATAITPQLIRTVPSTNLGMASVPLTFNGWKVLCTS